MWRVWPFLRTALLSLATLAGTIAATLLFTDIRKGVVDFFNGSMRFPIILASLILFLLLCLFSWRSHRSHRLRRQFDLLTMSESLSPEDLGFVSLGIGDQAPSGKRPHYPPYIHRVAVLYERKHQAEIGARWTEEGLANELLQGKGFLLIGEPTAGKSRTLLEIIRRLRGLCVLRPRTDCLPDEEALDLISGRKAIILLDDLNRFVNAPADLLTLTSILDRRKEWR